MAQTSINAGNVRATYKGKYDPRKRYEFNQWVTDNGSSYIVTNKNGAAPGDINIPGTWNYLALKGDKGDTPDIPGIAIGGVFTSKNTFYPEGCLDFSTNKQENVWVDIEPMPDWDRIIGTTVLFSIKCNNGNVYHSYQTCTKRNYLKPTGVYWIEGGIRNGDFDVIGLLKENGLAVNVIEEEGSNANGRFVKYKNGVLICSGIKKIEAGFAINRDTGGDGYISETKVVDMPYLFKDKKSFNFICTTWVDPSHAVGLCSSAPRDDRQSDGVFNCRYATPYTFRSDYGEGGIAYWIAIGYWK